MQQHFFIHFGFYNAVEDEDLVDSGFPTPTDSPPAVNAHVGLLQTWISAVLFTAFLYQIMSYSDSEEEVRDDVNGDEEDEIYLGVPLVTATPHPHGLATAPVCDTTKYDFSVMYFYGSLFHCQVLACNEEEEIDDVLQQLLADSCGCQLATDKKPCSTQFTASYFQKKRLECQDLTRKELDLVILGQLMAGIGDEPHTNDAKHRHGVAERKLTSLIFHHRGRRVCEKTFRMIHGIGQQYT